jgi:hypothetical protein
MQTDRLQRLLAIAAGPKAPDTPVTAVTPVTGTPCYGSKPPQLRELRGLRIENRGSPNRIFEAVTPLVTPSGEPAECDLPDTRSGWSEAHDERAAIVEFDGGAPRAWAEGFAQLDPARPPDDVPAKRWLRFVDDAGKFLDDGWAAKAAALGWGPLDLFGCDGTKRSPASTGWACYGFSTVAGWLR